MSNLFHALFSFNGTITPTMYWVSWGIMIVFGSALMHVLTRGWCWRDDYGVEGPTARSLAIAISVASLATTYPILALVTKALNTSGASWLWFLLILVPTVVQPITQWRGLNGSMAKPTPLAMMISVVYFVGIVAIGLGL